MYEKWALCFWCIHKIRQKIISLFLLSLKLASGHFLFVAVNQHWKIHNCNKHLHTRLSFRRVVQYFFDIFAFFLHGWQVAFSLWNLTKPKGRIFVTYCQKVSCVAADVSFEARPRRAWGQFFKAKFTPRRQVCAYATVMLCSSWRLRASWHLHEF
jgi:hypothetical protein